MTKQIVYVRKGMVSEADAAKWLDAGVVALEYEGDTPPLVEPTSARDAFAMAALTGMYGGPHSGMAPKHRAEAAFKQADHMLRVKALEPKPLDEN